MIADLILRIVEDVCSVGIGGDEGILGVPGAAHGVSACAMAGSGKRSSNFRYKGWERAVGIH